jgi:hypothetical protein
MNRFGAIAVGAAAILRLWPFFLRRYGIYLILMWRF